jgi:hypothetical protein
MAVAVLLLWLPGASIEAQADVQAPGTCDTGGSRNADCRMFLSVTSAIQETRRLVVSPGSRFSLAPVGGVLSVSDYDAGMFNTAGSIGLTIQSNAPWRVTVQASAPVMSGGCNGKNASTIMWGTRQDARTTPLSTSAATVSSGGTFTALSAENVYLRVAVGWMTDAPVAAANCVLPLSFQIGAP